MFQTPNQHREIALIKNMYYMFLFLPRLLAVFIQKTKPLSRQKFRLKYSSIAVKTREYASDGPIIRRKFRLNLCVVKIGIID